MARLESGSEEEGEEEDRDGTVDSEPLDDSDADPESEAEEDDAQAEDGCNADEARAMRAANREAMRSGGGLDVSRDTFMPDYLVVTDPRIALRRRAVHASRRSPNPSP